MKLAEALLHRVALKTEIAQLESRIVKNALVQEGEEPQEDSNVLLREFVKKNEELTRLITRIQRTNAREKLIGPDDRPLESTLQDALVKRDGRMTLAESLRSIGGNAMPDMRYRQMEIKLITTLDIAEIQYEANRLAKEGRELDILIQKTNWAVELAE